jgi:hypothetical protein
VLPHEEFIRLFTTAAIYINENDMIGYIEGKLLKKDDNRILILANQIGYEVLLPAFVMETFKARRVGDEVSLYIYHQQTERQPKPVLIGFNLEVEKEFFLLVVQLGNRITDAKKMIAEAMERNSSIGTPEELFEEIYRGEKALS